MTPDEALRALIGTLEQLRHRLAHALPGDLSADRVWHDTTTDLPSILAQARQALAEPAT